MKNVFGIILAGGNGERFWPMSTSDCPKQFVKLFGGKALIRHAADRVKGVIEPKNLFVITAERFIGKTREALPQIPEENIIGEPCRRDTASAVALATGLVKRMGGDKAVGCILTADHLMNPVDDFRKTLKAAIVAARSSDDIVTIGIKPTRPETGYGYIDPVGKRFVEKPDLKTARKYLRSGKYLWNSGMFIWKAATMEEAFRAHAPDFVRLIEEPTTKDYASLRSISVDFAIMEKVRNLGVVRGEFDWNDVGNWNSLPAILGADDKVNTKLGRTALHDVADSIIVNDACEPLAVIGLKDVVIVRTTKGTLIAARDRVQDIKKLIGEL